MNKLAKLKEEIELAETILEAHKALIDVSADNERKFASVLRMLKSELHSLKEQYDEYEKNNCRK